MLAQHRRIGESRADQSRMNASPHEILAGGPHHPKLGMFTDDITKGARDCFFGERGADVEDAGMLLHSG